MVRAPVLGVSGRFGATGETVQVDLWSCPGSMASGDCTQIPLPTQRNGAHQTPGLPSSEKNGHFVLNKQMKTQILETIEINQFFYSTLLIKIRYPI